MRCCDLSAIACGWLVLASSLAFAQGDILLERCDYTIPIVMMGTGAVHEVSNLKPGEVVCVGAHRFPVNLTPSDLVSLGGRHYLPSCVQEHVAPGPRTLKVSCEMEEELGGQLEFFFNMTGDQLEAIVLSTFSLE